MRETLVHPPPDLGQGLAEDDHAIVFVFIARLPPPLVVAILFSPARIAARGLDMAVRRGTNPDVVVGRGDGKAADAEQARFVANWFSFRIKVFEIFALALARVAGLIIADVAKTGLFRHLDRVRSDLDLGDFLFFFA